MTQAFIERILGGLALGSTAVGVVCLILSEQFAASEEAARRLARKIRDMAAPEELSPFGQRLQRAGLWALALTIVLFVVLFFVSTA